MNVNSTRQRNKTELKKAKKERTKTIKEKETAKTYNKYWWFTRQQLGHALLVFLQTLDVAFFVQSEAVI